MYACNSLLNYLKIFSGQSRVTRIFSVSWVGSGWVKNLVNIGRVKTRPTPIVYQKEEDDNVSKAGFDIEKKVSLSA